MNKLFPSLLLISLLFFHCKSEKICDGVLCDDSCNNCYNCKQEINCFINQNCFCASTNIPGGLSLEETPQFVFFTIDDSIDFSQFNVLDGYKFILNNAVIKDARGCTVRPTTYIMQQCNYLYKHIKAKTFNYVSSIFYIKNFNKNNFQFSYEV